MRRLPIVATVVVAAAVLVMIGLGVWQLDRAAWKEKLLADFATAPDLPAVNLDPFVAASSRRFHYDPPAVSFRRVRVTCYPSRTTPVQVRAGRNRATQLPGSSYFIPCFWDELYSWAEDLEVNVGWANRPDLRPVLPVNEPWIVEGVIGEVQRDDRIVITADRPLRPLQPSAAPRIEDVPNNHMLYAFQWFFFAAAALVIYALALRRRLSGTARDPKSGA